MRMVGEGGLEGGRGEVEMEVEVAERDAIVVVEAYVMVVAEGEERDELGLRGVLTAVEQKALVPVCCYHPLWVDLLVSLVIEHYSSSGRRPVDQFVYLLPSKVEIHQDYQDHPPSYPRVPPDSAADRDLDSLVVHP